MTHSASMSVVSVDEYLLVFCFLGRILMSLFEPDWWHMPQRKISNTLGLLLLSRITGVVAGGKWERSLLVNLRSYGSFGHFTNTEGQLCFYFPPSGIQQSLHLKDSTCIQIRLKNQISFTKIPSSGKSTPSFKPLALITLCDCLGMLNIILFFKLMVVILP